MTEEVQESWHVDKRVPLALIAAIIIQSLGAVWWASGINGRMQSVEKQIDLALSREVRSEDIVKRQGEQIAGLVVELKSTNRSLERLQNQMESTNALLREILSQAK